MAWLLAVALPLQGYAAQVMLRCGSAPHQGAALHHKVAQAHHDAGTPAADAAAYAAPAKRASHCKPAKAGGASKCSACANCGVPAALTTSIPVLAVVQHHSPEVSAPVATLAQLTLDGPERPPRHLLA